MPKLPDQRWHIASPDPEAIANLVRATGLSPLLARVLHERGVISPADAAAYIRPESAALPHPNAEFRDLTKSVAILKAAIEEGDAIAICGDYDADGMTSTALLIRALRQLGAEVDYAIPDRMKEGYGINEKIVESLAEAGVGTILTVDNGIAAYDAIALAADLGLNTIITDHHELPEKLPPADAILNPKLLATDSPYYSLAGVGVAYILAIGLAQAFNAHKGLVAPMLELFTLGTIADLACLEGVNRRWVKRGLRLIPQSQLPGVRALIQASRVQDDRQSMKPDDIGFQLGPRINAIGRISDPKIVIDLLTTDDFELALERAQECESANEERKRLCETIKAEAIAVIERRLSDWRQKRVLAIVQPNWHHGVIGIVASNLVERYGVPVFIGTYEEDNPELVRGSARGIPEFHVFEALEFCRDLLSSHGGHKAAGGFKLPAKHLATFCDRLSQFACQCLQPEHLKPLIEIDAQADFSQLSLDIYRQIDALHPWGIGNREPIFWTPNVRVVEQRLLKDRHLKLVLAQETGVKLPAVAWRWGEYCPLPDRLDIAYKVQENTWKGVTEVQLNLVGARLPAGESSSDMASKQARFSLNGRTYVCRAIAAHQELRIKNDRGQVLLFRQGQQVGLLKPNPQAIDGQEVSQKRYAEVIKAALAALKDS